MSITKESICNIGLMLCGQESIVSIDDANDPQAVKLKSVFTTRLEFLLGRFDWAFARKRLQLTRVFKITLDTAPAPAAFSLGATLTGSESGATCTVKKVESSTVYWVTEPSVDFTDGETIGDGENSVDCAAGYPEVDETPPAFGTWQYVYAMPDDYLANFKLVDKYNDNIVYPHYPEGLLFYANVTEGYCKYTRNITEMSELRGWFANLMGADLAKTLAPKFVGNDQYINLRVRKDLSDAWMDAISGNGSDSYFEGPGGETSGVTDSYEGFRLSDY